MSFSLKLEFEQQSCGNTTVGLASVALGEFSISNEFLFRTEVFPQLGYEYDKLRRKNLCITQNLCKYGSWRGYRDVYVLHVLVKGIASYQAMNYIRRSGATEEDLARVVVQNRRNAAKTWWAHLKMPTITIEDVLDTPYISYPLRFGMVCPATDGACAAVLMSEEKAKQFADIPVYINGVASIANETAIVGIDCA